MKIIIVVGLISIVCIGILAVYVAQQENSDDGIHVDAKTGTPLQVEQQQELLVDVEAKRISEKEKIYPHPPEILPPSAVINASEDVLLQDLIGEKVILVKFWTFACVNCQHTLPHVNEWYATYQDQGLEIISFHTPEFAYEHKLENVQNAVNKWGIKYPVLLDNDFANFRAYDNHYWPHMYLIDKEGFIVYDQIGQGDYEQTEAKIKELLAE